MKLGEQIAQFKAGRPAPPPEVAAKMKLGVESVRASGASGPRVGERAPEFTLPNPVGKPVRLADPDHTVRMEIEEILEMLETMIR